MVINQFDWMSGNKINAKQSLLTIYADSKNDYENVREKIEECFVISDTQVNELPETYEVIRK